MHHMDYIVIGSNQALKIQLTNVILADSDRLVIHGGLYGNDAILYDSNNHKENKQLQQQQGNVNKDNGIWVIAPCGKSVISFHGNITASKIMELTYETYGSINGKLCEEYSKIILITIYFLIL